MADSCGNTSLNPNVPCEQLDGQYKKPFLHTEDFSFADQDAAKLKATWDAGIQAGTIIPLPNLFSTESQDSGAAYDSSPLGDITVSNGTISFMFMIAANTELYKKLSSYAGRSDLRLSIGTATAKVKMLKNSDDTLTGFGIGLLNVENPTLNDGSAAEKAPIKITLDDITEFRDNAVVFKPSFNINRLKALSDVEIEITGTPSATTITFKVNKFSDNDDVKAANPVYGLVDSDLSLLDAAGTAQTIGGLSGGTVSEAGVYTLTGTGLVTGTLNLKDPAIMTTTGYSSVGAATVTI